MGRKEPPAVRVVQRRVRIRQSYLDAFLAAGVTATADIRASVKVPDPDAGELRERLANSLTQA
jgi:hypothetical protein